MKTSRYTLFLACTVLCALCWALPVQADVVWMVNGDRLSGRIEAIDKATIRIATAYGKPFTIQRQAVQRWRIETPDQRSLTAAKRSDPHSKPEVPEDAHWFWTGSADVNAKLKRNGSRRDDFNLALDSELASRLWRYTLQAGYTYETTDTATQTHKYRLIPKVDYFIGDSWYWRSELDYRYNLLAAPSLELDYATGPGYRFFNDRQQRLELMVQGGNSRMRWVDDSSLETHEANARNELPFVAFGWDYRQPFWSRRVEVFTDGSYKRFLSQPSPFISLRHSLSSQMGVRYYLNDRFRLAWRTELDWVDVQAQDEQYKAFENDKEWRQYLSLGATF